MGKDKKKDKHKSASKKSSKGSGRMAKESGKTRVIAKPSGKTKILKKKEKKEKRPKGSRQSSRPIVRRSTTPASSVVRAAPVKLTREMQEKRAQLQKMLSKMRRDIDHEVRGASARDLAHINDTSDMASDAAEGDLALRIAESETAEAGEIERAIEKIDSGTYGTCESCGQQIAPGRLEYLPYVTLCVRCQELAEIKRREEGDELDDLAEGSEADAENN